nr:hypothetical protein [Pseudomonas sp. UBA6718]
MAKEISVFHASPGRDLTIALSLTSILLCVILFLGDYLYIDIWYYLAIPIATQGLGLLLRCPPWFLTGSTIGAICTLLTYAFINYQRAEGLLVLGHLFSLPGAAAGVLVSAVISRKLRTPSAAFLLGLGGLLLGFGVNQLVICNTLMWCGPLSWSPT